MSAIFEYLWDGVLIGVQVWAGLMAAGAVLFLAIVIIGWVIYEAVIWWRTR